MLGLWIDLAFALDLLVATLNVPGEYETKNLLQSREKTPKIFTLDWILTNGAGLIVARKTQAFPGRFRQKFCLHRSW